jgi:iron(III) transport system ATP-binding protein
MPNVTIHNLTKRYGPNTVLDNINFEVTDGELFTLLGPSGCGKTTTLLSIAGFVKPDHGTITAGTTTLHDTTTNLDIPAERRNLGLVFQTYAIWPHMTVAENVAFPLKIRNTNKQTRQTKTTETLKLVELNELADRYPHQLSGGQRQRVALARALIYQPTVLLLDEPFSNLDAKLRERARTRLKHLQHQLGLTTIFVTHDQHEAMQMSDRILVMNQGQIQQIATPEHTYKHPTNQFVATFLGQCNLLDGVIAKAASRGAIEVLVGHTGPRLLVTTDTAPTPDTAVSLAIRPESVRLLDAGSHNGAGSTVDHENVFDVSISDVAFLGDHYEYRVRAGDVQLLAHSPHKIATGALKAAIDPGACQIV